MIVAESNTWDELALEVVRAARERMSARDFKIQCQLTPVTSGKSYFDRMRVAEKLIEERIVELDDGYFRLSMREAPDWLLNGLKVGSIISWEILETIDPTHKLSAKFDRLLLEKIGLEGELAVMDMLTDELPKSVLNRLRHVSLTDDSVGFDIHSPSVLDSANTVLLEVKTSSRPGDEFHFFISRNEARVASLNENWRLLAVVRRPSGYKVIGTISFNYFSQYLPIDAPSRGRWESASISIPVNAFIAGLP